LQIFKGKLDASPPTIIALFDLPRTGRAQSALPTGRTTATSGPLALRYGPLGSELRTVVTIKV
jgi:hypothetical protein